MPKTDNIVKFLQTAFSDERLALLLAHAQDGKLAFYSCCCFVGASTADHALVGAIEEHWKVPHYIAVLKLPYAVEAECEFCNLGAGWKSSDEEKDDDRRKAITPIIEAEMLRREEIRTLSFNPEISWQT